MSVQQKQSGPMGDGFHVHALHRRVAVISAAAILGVVTLLTVSNGFVHSMQFASLDRVLERQSGDPKILLQVLGWNDAVIAKNPYGLSRRDAYKVQHLALLRLLELQKTHFGNGTNSPADGCVGRDTTGAGTIGYNRSGNIIVQGTPALFADQLDSSDVPYWNVELFEFTTNGRLVNRQCYTTEGEHALLNGANLPSSKK